MTAARRWYERVLGAVLLLVGAVFLLPLAGLWIWAHHMYTVGLSVDLVHALPVLVGLVISFGVLFVLGGVALLRRA